MKKNIFLIVLLLLLNTRISHAEYIKSLEDYTYQFEQYRLAHQNYSVSKNKYLSYNTPTSLAEALENGKKAILLRDMVLLTYFQTLKDRLQETPGLTPENLVVNSSSIDTELLFLSSHKDKAQSTISLRDLTEVSKELEVKQNVLHGLSKITLGTILTTRLETLKDNVSKNQDFLSFTVSQNKSVLQNSINMERWLIEAKNKIVLAGQKIEEAKNNFQSADNQSDYSISDKFSKGQLALMAGNQYLKEAINFQKEVMRGITND